MGGSKLAKLAGAAQIALGVGFALRGIGNLMSPSGGSQFFGDAARSGGTGRDRILPADDAVTTARVETVGDIDDRVRKIIRLAVADSLDPAVRGEAIEIVGQKCGAKWCIKPKDYVAELGALFQAIADPRSKYAVRYTRDHVAVDQFAAAAVVRKWSAGDCDDATSRLGSWAMSIGYPVKFRVVQVRGEGTFGHIYLVAGVPPTNPTRWMALDPTVEGFQAGDQAPGAARALVTGKPSEMIEKTRDFPITLEHFQSMIGTQYHK